MSGQLIGHLDADCFYVSCERVRSPSLLREPVGVLGNQGACVIAKSYEMKAQGVKTGMPIWESVKCCPEGIYIKRDFLWYEVISRQMLELLRTVSPTVEYYSIDEMFFRAEQLPQVFRQPLPQAVLALQQRVLHEVCVPASIGISLSKTLAKLASDGSKPFGCAVLLEQEEIERFLCNRPVEEISGIGERSRQKLALHGILTCRDFAQADRRFLRKLLTIRGEQLWWELHGTPMLPIHSQRPPHKCLGRGGSLGEATSDPARLVAWMRPEMVDIPACFGLDKGVWFQIREGIRGILVLDERGQPHVYMLTEPASHYYQVMTRSRWMPVLVGSKI